MSRKTLSAIVFFSLYFLALSGTCFSISGCNNPPDPAAFGEDWRHKKLIYTKHARCRMKCRSIDESEIKEILEKGRVNAAKSDTASRPDPKYALDGITHDRQHVRVVFAASKKGVVVITVIDLDTDWSCDCR
jgi:hypothetical protein